MLSNLTDEESNLLLQFSYIDVPKNLGINPDHPPKMKDVLDKMALFSPDLKDNDKFQAFYSYVNGKDGDHLGSLTLVGYQNNDPSLEHVLHGESNSGFVAYALKDEEGNATALLRGSEPIYNPKHFFSDWTGNVEAGVGETTKQHDEAAAFYEKYIGTAEGNKYVMGHSKGGNLADYILAKYFHKDKDLKAYTVNAAPLNWLMLTEAQREVLKGDRNTFIVHEDDWVSQLGYAPYVDKTVPTRPEHGFGEHIDPTFAHGLSTVEFDENGKYIGAKDGRSSGRAVGNVIVGSVMNGATVLVNPDVTIELVRRSTHAIYQVLRENVSESITQVRKKMKLVREECMKIVMSIEKANQKLNHLLHHYFDQIGAKVEKFFVLSIGKIAGTGSSIEPYIKVDFSRLADYISRLEAIKRKTNDVNRLIESLYGEAELLGLGHVLKADFNGEINGNIQFLKNTMEILQRSEAKLQSMASSIR